MRRVPLAIAAGILLLADAVLLLGVARSRRAGPDAQLALTERELTLGVPGEDNSAVLLRLEWRAGEEWESLRQGGVDARKLAALGFRLRPGRTDNKPCFAVLELDASTPDARTRLKQVDVGLDPADLRKRYPDARRYAITRAVARGFWDRRSDPPAARGYIRPTNTLIYVPAEHLPVFRGLAPSIFPIEHPRYEATLCFTHGGYPWLCGARRIGN